MPQGRIPDKFTVLEEPKEEQSLTFSDFFYWINPLLQWVHAIYMSWLKIENIKYVLNNKTLNKNWFGPKKEEEVKNNNKNTQCSRTTMRHYFIEWLNASLYIYLFFKCLYLAVLSKQIDWWACGYFNFIHLKRRLSKFLFNP